jgi:hypothetical protein
MKRRTDDGWDAPLANLMLILENVGEGKRFGMLTHAERTALLPAKTASGHVGADARCPV